MKYSFLVLLTCLTLQPVSAQRKTVAVDTTALDSNKITFVEKMTAFAKKSATSSTADFEADKAALAQDRIFEEIKKDLQKAKSYLRTIGDSTNNTLTLDLIEQDYRIAGDGVLTNKGTAQTFRNLTATSKILNELLAKASDKKIALDLRRQQLNTFRYQLDSLISAPMLFKFSTDSVVLSKYLQQIRVVAYEMQPIDVALKQATLGTQALLNRTNMLVFKLQTSLDEISAYQKDMAKNTFRREFGNIWEPASYYRPFSEILAQAQSKGWLTLVFYLENNTGKLFILAFLIFGSFLYLHSLKSIYKQNDLLANNFEGQLVLRYPILSAVLLVVNIFQFIFLSPPFLLSVVFWTSSCVCLTFIFRRFITKYWMNVWLVMVSLFLLTAADNLVLQASRIERWLILLLALAGVIAGALIIFKGKRQELREKLILISIGFMTVLEFSAVITNCFGRYNLSKTLLISGYLNVVIAILFLWTIRLINEGLFLAFSVYTQQDRKLFYLNFDKVGKKVPPIFYVLLVLGWLILFGRNFAGFDSLAGPLREFFGKERTLGDYTFSVNGLLLFFVIMAVSVIISKVVSFFASDRHLAHEKDDRNNAKGIGSWLLLIRIAILSIGLFLAVAAAGIPIDRITIVLGALGVGIGFGLQTMVNHLVSGLIIAFEKPVNVGDIVDVDGQAGTMKSVGFRSSVITTFDGADVVMPNGDLLNSHLINWTLAGNRRRTALTLEIVYHADLELVKNLLTQIVAQDERIAKKPVPIVQYNKFGNGAIEVQVFFWAKDYREANAVKSDLIISITTQFRSNQISLAPPIQEIHIQPNNGTTGQDKK